MLQAAVADSGAGARARGSALRERRGVVTSALRSSIRKPNASMTLMCVVVGILVAASNLRHGAIPDTNALLDINPWRFILQTLAPFNSTQLGQATPGSAGAYLPMAVVFLVGRVIHVPLVAVQGIWITTIVAVSGVGMAWLFREWTGRDRPVQIAASALLYMANPYVWYDMKGSTELLIPYVCTPILCVLAVKALRSRQAHFVVWIGVLFGFSGIGVNPPEAIIAACVVGAFAVTEVLRGTVKPGAAIRVIAGIVIAVVLLSVWWMGPFIAYLGTSGAQAYFTTDPMSIQAWASSFREVLRLMGLWAAYSGNNGVPYYPESAFLNSNTVVALTLAAPALFIAAIGRLSQRENWRALLLGVLVAVSVPLAVGTFPPATPGLTGQIYSWLSVHVVGFDAFRSVYKWVAVIALAYALAIPVCIDALAANAGRLADFGRQVGGALVAGLVVVYLIPGITGDLFPASYRLGDIPKYWYEAGQWLTQQPVAGRVLFVPLMGFPQYTWGAPSGDIAAAVTSRASLMSQPGIEVPPVAEEMFNLLSEAGSGASVPFVQIVRMLGVKFVVAQGDVAWQAIGSPRPRSMLSFLLSQDGLKETKVFGKLVVFTVQGPIAPMVGEARKALTVASNEGLAGAIGQVQGGNQLIQPASTEVQNSAVATVTASSVWNGDTAGYGPSNVFSGVPGEAWVSGVPYGDGQWVRAVFRHPVDVRSVTVEARQDGVDAVPKFIWVTAGARTKRALMERGQASVEFSGSAVSSLVVRLGLPGPGGPNVGLSSIRIAGVPVNSILYPAVGVDSEYKYQMDLGPDVTGSESLEVAARSPSSAMISGTVTASATESQSTLERYLEVSGLSSVTASSRWYNLAAYSPVWTLAGDRSMAWVPQTPGGIGAWVQYGFPRARSIGRIVITPRSDGVDKVVSGVTISVDGHEYGRFPIHSGPNVVNVNAVGSSLRLTIDGASGGRGWNVGLSAVRIPGVSVARNISAIESFGTLSLNGSGVQLRGTRINATVPANSIQYEDELAVGQAARQIAPTSVALTNGVNRFGWQTGSLLVDDATLQLVGGSGRASHLIPLKVRNVGASRIVTSSVERGIVMLSDNGDVPWTARGVVVGGSSSNALGYGPEWKVTGPGRKIQLAVSTGRPVREWIVVEAGLVACVGLVLGFLRVRRKRT